MAAFFPAPPSFSEVRLGVPPSPATFQLWEVTLPYPASVSASSSLKWGKIVIPEGIPEIPRAQPCLKQGKHSRMSAAVFHMISKGLRRLVGGTFHSCRPSLLASQWIWSSVQTVYVSPEEFLTQTGLLQLITSRANNLSLGGWAWHKHLHPARGQPRG